jgi:hypothetical protein
MYIELVRYHCAPKGLSPRRFAVAEPLGMAFPRTLAGAKTGAGDHLFIELKEAV